MLLSALAFAAALQAAPMADQQGALLKHEPFDWARPHKKPALSSPEFRPWTPEGARFRVAKRGNFKPTPRDFVVNPQMTNCKTAPQLVGHPETLTVQPLSKMPEAHGERAVARLVDGCPVAVMIAQR